MSSDEDNKIDKIIEKKLDERIERKLDERMKQEDGGSAHEKKQKKEVKENRRQIPGETGETQPDPPGFDQDDDSNREQRGFRKNQPRRVGEKRPERVFTKSYVIRESLFVLIGRLLLVEIIFVLLYYIFFFLFGGEPEPAATTSFITENESSGLSVSFTVFTFLKILHLLIIFYVLGKWYFRKYIISPQEIYYMRGLLLRRKDVYHIQAMVAVRVFQGVMGRILNFGTIRLESPLLKRDVMIRKIHDPHKHAQVIENQRLKSIQSIVTEDVVPT